MLDFVLCHYGFMLMVPSPLSQNVYLEKIPRSVRIASSFGFSRIHINAAQQPEIFWWPAGNPCHSGIFPPIVMI